MRNLKRTAISLGLSLAVALGGVPSPGLAWAWKQAAGGPAVAVADEGNGVAYEETDTLVTTVGDGDAEDSVGISELDGNAPSEQAPLLMEEEGPDVEPTPDSPVTEQGSDAVGSVAPAAEEPAVTLREVLGRVAEASGEDAPDATVADQGHLIVEMVQDDLDLAALCAIDAEEIANAAGGDADDMAQAVADATGSDPETVRVVVEDAVANATGDDTDDAAQAVADGSGDVTQDVKGAVEDVVRDVVVEAVREATGVAVADDMAELSEAIDGTDMHVSDTLAVPSDESCGTYLVNVPGGMPLSEARARLLQSPDVRGVYYDYFLEPEPCGDDGYDDGGEAVQADDGGDGSGDEKAEGMDAYESLGVGDTHGSGDMSPTDFDEPEPTDIPDPEPPTIPANDVSKSFHLVSDPSQHVYKWEADESYLDFRRTWQTARDAGWRDSSNVTIAIIDSGIQMDHPDLKDNIIATYDVTGSSGINEISSLEHGTKVAGIASARTNNGVGICSLAYNANLLPIQVAVPDATKPSGVAYSTSRIIKALEWLLTEDPHCDNRTPADFYNVKAINMSLITYKNQTSDDTIQLYSTWVGRCWEHGIVLVSGMGNKHNGGDTETEYTLPYEAGPQCYAKDRCVGVIGLRQDGETGMARYEGSNYNMSNDDIVGKVSAPGANLLSTRSNSGYQVITGTSYAAPQVASLLALMFSAYPTMTPDQAVELLCDNTKAVTGGNPTPQEVGYGMIDPVKTLQAVIAAKPELKADPGISFPKGAYYDVRMSETPAIGVVTAPGASPVTYVYEMRDGDTECATVDEDGTIHPIKLGTIHVGVMSAANAYYSQGHRVVTIHVIGEQTVSAQDVSVSVGSIGEITPTITPEDGHGQVTYECADTSVAEVDATGKVTPRKAGATTVTIRVEGTQTLAPAETTVALTVTKATNPMTAKASKASLSVTYSPKAATVTPKNVGTTGKVGALSYENASTTEATRGFEVDAATGEVTLPKATGAGTNTVKVKVTAAGNQNYEPGSKVVSYKIVVAKAANPMTAKSTKASLSATYDPKAATVTPKNVGTARSPTRTPARPRPRGASGSTPRPAR